MDPEDEIIDETLPEGELDDQQEPPEPEYDDDGNEIVAETPPEGEGDETPPEEPEAPYVPSYAPPAGELPGKAKLKALLADPEMADALSDMVNEAVSVATASSMAGQSHMTAIAASNPELWKAYGSAAAAILAQQPPEQRASRENVESTIMVAALGAHMGKPTYPQALARYSALVNKQAAPREPKAPIPAAQRPPSPASRSASPTPNKDRIEVLVNRYGVSKSEAEDMLSDVSRPLAGGGRRPL